MPTSDGYARVSIAPRISPTLGPSAVNASLVTIRGKIESDWVRGRGGSEFLRLRTRVPTGVVVDLSIPILGRSAPDVLLCESGALLWPDSTVNHVGITSVTVGVRDGSEAMFRVGLSSGEFLFKIVEAQTSGC